jgi:hypothetical protein
MLRIKRKVEEVGILAIAQNLKNGKRSLNIDWFFNFSLFFKILKITPLKK